MRALPLVLLLAACGSMPPPTVVTNIQCPQPTAETLSAADELPVVPELSSDPSVTIGLLSSVIELDREVFANEKAKRTTLINHGVSQCRWSR